MLPLTVSKVYKNMFYKKNMTLYIINDLPMTHTYIHLPTKWGYTNIDSSTQPSGDTSDINCSYMTEILHHPSHA